MTAQELVDKAAGIERERAAEPGTCLTEKLYC
jgi:hypothetical protein